jgi:hypothetical protein
MMMSFLTLKQSSSHLFDPSVTVESSSSSASFFCLNSELDEVFHSNSLSTSSSTLKGLLAVSLNPSSFLLAVNSESKIEGKEKELRNLWNVNDYVHRLLLSSIPKDALSIDEVKTNVIKSDLSVTQDSFSPGFPSSSRPLSSTSLGSATLPSSSVGLSSIKGLFNLSFCFNCLIP